jgi:hypothetical protein
MFGSSPSSPHAPTATPVAQQEPERIKKMTKRSQLKVGLQRKNRVFDRATGDGGAEPSAWG